MKVSFTSDSVKVYGPKVDGSFKVELNVSEGEQFQVATLLGIPQMTLLQVDITPKDLIDA